MRSSTPTMRDVAKIAGVSIQTVSAIINDKPGITQETKERVLSAIQTLGYRPFSVARSLRTRQTHTISLVVSDIANPAFSTLASAVEDTVHSFGYSLVVYNTHNDPQREKSCIQAITQRWIDGVLFVSTGDEMTGLDSLKAAGIAVVAIDRIPADYEGPAVVLDNFKAGALAVQHLVDLGHRRITHIRGPVRLRLAREREAGFRSVLAANGLEMLCGASEAKSWTCQAGYSGMQEVLQCASDLTALFAASDRLAIGAMRAINENGLSVPGAVSVVGVDDIEVSAFQNPPLTTVRQSFSDLGVKAVSILLEIINGARDLNQQVKIDPVLVVRESTRRLDD